MRTLTLAALLATPAVAHADGMRPFPTLSPTVSVVLRDDHGGGTDTTAAGVNLELAVGSGRFQYFGEGSAAYLKSTDQPGNEMRGGLGVRWLARSFELGHEGAFELNLEGLAGLTKLHHEVGDSHVYPDVGFGVAWAVRVQKPRLTFRMSARAMFEQTRRDMTTGSSSPAFVAVFGFGY